MSVPWDGTVYRSQVGKLHCRRDGRQERIRVKKRYEIVVWDEKDKDGNPLSNWMREIECPQCGWTHEEAEFCYKIS
jgi:hypothetical protein